MNNNGSGIRLDWLDRARVYAALAETEDPYQASLLLEREGLSLNRKQISDIAKNALEGVHRVRESGLASALLGPAGRRFLRVRRLDELCGILQQRLSADDLALDRELAAVLQQYRELVALTTQLDDCPSPADRPDAAPAAEGEGAGALDSLLEVLNHEPAGDGEFTDAVCAAARRLAAASGQAFAAPEPDPAQLA